MGDRDIRFFVGVTDNDWFRFLASKRPDEVNFWRPGGRGHFRALSSNELFLFKLHSPVNMIAGGGFFVRHSLLPVSIAWAAFGEKNGTRSQEELLRKVWQYRKANEGNRDPVIGCLILAQPFFWPEDEWLPAPEDWHPSIVQGKGYTTADPVGKKLFDAVMERIQRQRLYDATEVHEHETENEPNENELRRFGKEQIIRPRLGQGAFRVVVLEAYHRRCAVTGAKVLPILDAAHIKPFAADGPNSVNNGLLLRQDLHTLFDRGYVTVDPSYRLVVSRRLKEDFHNGEEYYAHHGKPIALPENKRDYPDRSYIEWHNEHVFIA